MWKLSALLGCTNSTKSELWGRVQPYCANSIRDGRICQGSLKMRKRTERSIKGREKTTHQQLQKRIRTRRTHEITLGKSTAPRLNHIVTSSYDNTTTTHQQRHNTNARPLPISYQSALHTSKALSITHDYYFRSVFCSSFGGCAMWIIGFALGTHH